MTFYIFVSVKYLEEKDLREAIGKEYEEYHLIIKPLKYFQLTYEYYFSKFLDLP